MWSNLNLRRRMTLLLAVLLLAVFAVSIAAFKFAADDDFESEYLPFQQQARETTSALNSALAASTNPNAVLQAFVQKQINVPASYFSFQSTPDVKSSLSEATAPAWFLSVFGFSNFQKTASFPVFINGHAAGYLAFYASNAADIDEKWEAFKILLAILLVVGGGSITIAYFVLGNILQPVSVISQTLADAETADSAQPIEFSGPPDFFPIMRSVNHLGEALSRLKAQNKDLLSAMVSTQDQERDEIARDVHDELGPVLFALRAHTIALIQRDDVGEYASYKLRDLETAISSLQDAYRLILDRLRPIAIEEMGLSRSLSIMIEGVRTQQAQMNIKAWIDPAVNRASPMVARTIYRLVQESLLNVQKHADASQLGLNVSVSPSTRVTIKIHDNGRGFPMPLIHGRGLRGMDERVQALGGRLLRDNRDGAFLECELPLI